MRLRSIGIVLVLAVVLALVIVLALAIVLAVVLALVIVLVLAVRPSSSLRWIKEGTHALGAVVASTVSGAD